MTVVPKVLGVSHLECVTCYQWLDLRRCELKGLGAALVLDGHLPEMPPTRSQLIGRFHHRLMELASSTDSLVALDRLIEDEISKLQATINASALLRRLGSVSGWHEVNQSATLARTVATSRVSDAGAFTAAAEKELRSRNGMLVGRPDRFHVGNGAATIREYKTGRIRTDSGDPLPDHLEQLRFYSALVVDNFPVTKVVARVESLSGDSYEVDVGLCDIDSLIERVSTALAALNKRISQRPPLESFAMPGSEVCLSCRNQIICPAFKTCQNDIGLVGDQFLCEGVVTALAPSGLGAVNVVTVLGGNGRVSVNLVVPADVAAGIAVGRAYVFQGLRSHGGRLAWGAASRVFSCE
jgi:hypothetical protein